MNAVEGLTKIPREESKKRKWGLVFSPPTLNAYFRTALLEPHGWLEWDETKQKYRQPRLAFDTQDTISGAARFRTMDGLKERVGLEIQFGKYAFMGYDIFSKMIIFKNLDRIDYGVEIVPVQQMVDCMSTGVSAFEHIMIDFEHRGEADIDIPVWVIGIGPTEDEWRAVYEIQQMYKEDPVGTREKYPAIGSTDLLGIRPGPK